MKSSVAVNPQVLRVFTVMNRMKNQLLSAATYEQMRVDLITCALPPGLEFTEGEVCARYRAGKATARSALTRLVQERLVRSEPRRGYVVTPITMRDVRELFDARRLIEPQVVAIATGQLTDRLLQDLRAAVRKTEKPETLKSPTALFAAVRDVGVTIAQTTGNHRLVRIVGDLLYESERVMHLGYLHVNLTSTLLAHQKELLEAMAKGDPGRAAAKCAGQLLELKNAIQSAVTASPEAMQINLHAAFPQPLRPHRFV